MTIAAAHVCELTWNAHAVARFWEPGAEEWVREKLYLPPGTHVTAAMFDGLKVDPFREAEGPTPGNRLVTVGLDALTYQLKTGVRAWTPSSGGSGYAGLGVGTGTTADAIGNQDLSGGSKSFRVCDDGFMTSSNGVMRFFTTWASAEANFSWDEYCVVVPTGGSTAWSGAVSSRSSISNGNHVLLNRKSPAGLGIKASGASASLDLTITII